MEKESALLLVKSPNLNKEYTRHGAAHIRGLPIRVCIFRCLAIPTREYGGQPTFFNNELAVQTLEQYCSLVQDGNTQKDGDDSWKAFLGGAVCAILVFIFVPFFAEGMSPSVAIAKMTNSPLKIISLIETIGISGVIFGCVFSLFAWIGRRKREREETDELMREYLKKKLQEENDKQ